MKCKSVRVFGLFSALISIACSQTPDRKRPAPFDRGPVKIALVQYSGAGDYFELWTKGARQQADAAGFEMKLYDAKADDAKQVADMKTALGSKVAGIIVDHGRSSTMCPLINQATKANISVVVYDVEITECAPDAIETAQNDSDLATLVLTQMAKDVDELTKGAVSAVEQNHLQDELRAKLPELNLGKTASAPWIRSVTF